VAGATGVRATDVHRQCAGVVYQKDGEETAAAVEIDALIGRVMDRSERFHR
jgi:hypothetical protein